MDLIKKNHVKTLVADQEPPCVSFFLSTERIGAEQNRIRWKNMLGAALDRLQANGMRPADVRAFLKPAEELGADEMFWKHQSQGLAYFLGKKIALAFRLPRTFDELVVVGERFHILPMLPILENDGRFFILALSQKKNRLLEATHYTVEEVEVEGVPPDLETALRFHDTDEPLEYHTHPALALGRRSAIFHGHGVGKDDAKDDLLNYFAQVDRGLHATLHEEKAPLIVAAVDYLMPIYRKANTYSHLASGSLSGNPDLLSCEQLRDRAWALVEPTFKKAREERAQLYARLAGTGRTCKELNEILAAAAQGRIEILFAESDREQWGTVAGAGTGQTKADTAGSASEGLINRAALETIRHGGSVHMLAASEMPSGAALPAAVFWLPHARKAH